MGGLYRSRDDRIFAGVCGGIANQIGFPPFVIRLLFIFLPISIIAYIVMALIIPEKPY